MPLKEVIEILDSPQGKLPLIELPTKTGRAKIKQATKNRIIIIL